jgi:putative Mg2+ transporter-C (MgtC) family protein
MPLTITWWDIAVRLLLSVLAGALIGFNRTEHGRPAGLRTTLLVCLAASLSMILANLLMATNGKEHDSFVNIDVMRLPLGILTGIGFIGGGAILHRQSLVLGVTTAAALWFVTVMGLCFGAGQIALGLVALALAMIVLWGMAWIETFTKTEKRPVLTILTRTANLGDDPLAAQINSEGFKIVASTVAWSRSDQHLERTYQLHRHCYPGDITPPAFLVALAARPDVLKLTWLP